MQLILNVVACIIRHTVAQVFNIATVGAVTSVIHNSSAVIGNLFVPSPRSLAQEVLRLRLGAHGDVQYLADKYFCHIFEDRHFVIYTNHELQAKARKML